MRIKTRCPACGKKLGGPVDIRGKEVKCSKCNHGFVIPADLEPIPDNAPGYSPTMGAKPSPAPPAAAAVEPEDELQLISDAPPDCGPVAPGGMQPPPGVPIGGPSFGPRARSGPRGGGGWMLLVVAGALGAGGYFGWEWWQTQQPVSGTSKNESKEGKSDDPEAAPGKSGAKTRSAVVVENGRYPMLIVFGPKRLGEVPRGQTETFELEWPAQSAPPNISFEVKGLPRGFTLTKVESAQFDKGLPFKGDTNEGLRIAFPGPPSEMLPAADEVLQSVTLQAVEVDRRTNNGAVESFLYKGRTLRAPVKGQKLQLAMQQVGERKELRWIVQDCVIEQDGQTLYKPPEVPWTSAGVKLAAKDGKLAPAE